MKTLKEAIEAFLHVCQSTSVRNIRGATEAMIKVMYDEYGKEKVDEELERQLNKKI